MISHPEGQHRVFFQEHSHPDSHAISQHPHHAHSHSHSSGSALSVFPMTPTSQNFPQYTSLYTIHFHLQFDDTAAAGLSPVPIQFFSGGLESFFIALCRLNLSWRRAPLASQALSPPPILISVSIQMHSHSFLFKCRFRWPRLHSRHARTLPSNHNYHHLQRLRPPFRHRALPIVFSFPSLFTLVLVPKARFPVNFLLITNPVGRESLSFRSV